MKLIRDICSKCKAEIVAVWESQGGQRCERGGSHEPNNKDERVRMTPGELTFWERIVIACIAGPDSVDGAWSLDSMCACATNAVEERRKIVPIDPRTDAFSEVDALLCDLLMEPDIKTEMKPRMLRARTKIRGLYKSV
jgi:hypothetical protein